MGKLTVWNFLTEKRQLKITQQHIFALSVEDRYDISSIPYVRVIPLVQILALIQGLLGKIYVAV